MALGMCWTMLTELCCVEKQMESLAETRRLAVEIPN